MTLKKRYFTCLIIITLESFTLISGQKATRQSAAEAFSRGNYELAYSQFSELLALYPRDPLYKYYSAACLVNMKKDPEEAGRLIGEALSSGSLKSLPDDAIFYLARAQHLQGKFDEAEKAYNRFIAEAGRKKARDLKVPDYLQQCKAGTGKLEVIIPVAVAEKKPADPEPLPVVSPAAKQPLPREVDSELGRKLEMEYRADSAPPPATTIVTGAPPATEAAKPAVIASPVRTIVTEDIAEIKDTTIKIREILNKPTAVFSVFEILPQPVTDPKATIEINPEPPEGLIYRIQIAVFRNPVQLSYFKGISPIYGIKGQGATVTTYYAGIFRQSADAAKALAGVRAKGFKDSFVVAQTGNKTVSSERAAIMEKEWGNKPLFNINETAETERPDTIPPTLLLKVEVARSIQPLREDAIEPMRKMAGSRSFDVFTLENGSTAYLIGNFITFESAENFAGLLRKNGYRDAKVVAWLGRREIDIQTAKQLFETLK